MTVGEASGQLSTTTMSPGRKVGTPTCATSTRKLSPLIGPSSPRGAVISSHRKAARKVFQFPCGALAMRAGPRLFQPCVRVILVLVRVSAMKTRRLGSSRDGIFFLRARWRAKALFDQMKSSDRKGSAQIQRVEACSDRKSRATFSEHALGQLDLVLLRTKFFFEADPRAAR